MSVGPDVGVFGLFRVIAPVEWMVLLQIMLEYKRIIDVVKYKNLIYELVL